MQRTTMTFEDIFDFVSDDDIRLKGHRIGIDDILFYFVEGYSPEEIQAQLPSISLRQIYGTITYYLYNRTEVDHYLSRLESWRDKRYKKGSDRPSDVGARLRKLKTERQSVAAA